MSLLHNVTWPRETTNKNRTKQNLSFQIKRDFICYTFHTSFSCHSKAEIGGKN